MRDDFAVFVLSHGRPDRVVTVDSLTRSGYTGRVYIVIDDEDPSGDEYRRRFENVLVFSKEEIAATFDVGDLEPDRRTIVYARNACWRLARDVGVRFFAEFDDDYGSFLYRVIGLYDGSPLPVLRGWTIENLDGIFEAMIRFVERTPTASLAMSQGGDWLGGTASSMAPAQLKRKAMNSFVCDVEKPFQFVGRINEDVNTYVALGRTGRLFFTYSGLQLNQLATQGNEGGMTDVYLQSGTYVKSFFTVMYAPSCVQIRSMGRTDRRLHHRINWATAVPKIVSEDHRKSD